ncbi:YciI family protein [Arthrobacter sp. CJ23]|uniref:YciI family protein n=1 Tax=Arthrobacter sp. CJ23 TaxID=2972479 RepID=UPI00215CD0FD|nr:YciI family protein [Arthrobacter sp. CJ23]UVJ39088.1 YciI family protein [Arthrobacter sp. CJ23]
MKKFVVLYKSPKSAAEAIAEASPEEAEAGMKMWTDWAAKAGDGLVDFGTPLGAAKVMNGSSVSDGDATLGGYSIVQAEDLDAAVALMEGHPHFMSGEGAEIQVIETLEIPGM